MDVKTNILTTTPHMENGAILRRLPIVYVMGVVYCIGGWDKEVGIWRVTFLSVTLTLKSMRDPGYIDPGPLECHKCKRDNIAVGKKGLSPVGRAETSSDMSVCSSRLVSPPRTFKAIVVCRPGSTLGQTHKRCVSWNMVSKSDGDITFISW